MFRSGESCRSRRRDSYPWPRCRYSTDYYFPLVIEPEKDIIMIITPKEKVAAIRDSIFSELELDKTGNGVVFVLPVLETTGLLKTDMKNVRGAMLLLRSWKNTGGYEPCCRWCCWSSCSVYHR